jgi:hypothetical protein
MYSLRIKKQFQSLFKCFYIFGNYVLTIAHVHCLCLFFAKFLTITECKIKYHKRGIAVFQTSIWNPGIFLTVSAHLK